MRTPSVPDKHRDHPAIVLQQAHLVASATRIDFQYPAAIAPLGLPGGLLRTDSRAVVALLVAVPLFVSLLPLLLLPLLSISSAFVIFLVAWLGDHSRYRKSRCQ
jgi:hypothetical protein